MEKESRRHVAMEQPLAVTCLHLYLPPTSAIFDIQLSVLRGHSFFFIPATTAVDIQVRRISIPDFIRFILILDKEPVFPF